MLIDRTDKKILEILQNNSQISNQELAEKVSLSPSPCLRRVKQLEENGYIKKYTAQLDAEKLGLELTILVAVGLNGHDHKKMRAFEKTIKTLPEVVQCYLIAGQTADYQLKVIVPDLKGFQNFMLNKLTLIDGVVNIHSSFVLSSIVDRSSLPLGHL